MTIASTTNKVSYNGAGSAGPFSIPFKFLKDADITATHVSTAGLETVLTITTDYTLTGAGNPFGGSLTLNAVLASGEKLVIKRSPGIVQEVDYVENANFPAESHETALDLLTMICQDLDERLGRAVLVEISSTTSPSDLLEELAADVTAAADSAASAAAAETAAETAQGLAEDARDTAIAAVGGVKVSADDTMPGPLEAKLVLASNSGLVLATTSPGGDERRTMSIDLDADSALVLGAGGLKVDAGTTEGKVPVLLSGGALPAVSGANLTDMPGSGLAVRNALRLAILGTDAATAIPGGWLDVFVTDTLATKTGATYDAAGDFYGNAGGYTDETANIASIAQSNFNQGGTCTLTALRDGTLTGGCGTQSEAGSSVDLVFSTAKTIGKISFYNYANTERLKDFTIRRYNGGAWTKVPITSITEGGTVVNTDEGQVSNANGWVTCIFDGVSDTQFRLAFTSVWGIGDVNAYLAEAKIYSIAGASSMTLVPAAFSVGTATTRLEVHFLHKAIDATTLNTDIKVRATANDGTNWSGFGTIESLGATVSGFTQLKAVFTGLTSGTQPKVEITTYNAKSQQVRGLAMLV